MALDNYGQELVRLPSITEQQKKQYRKEQPCVCALYVYHLRFF
jgi:hypothetical protein